MHAKQVLIYLPCRATSSLNEMIDNVLIIKVFLLNGFWSLRTNLGRKPYYGGRCSPGLIESETGALMWSTPIPHGWTQSHQTMKESAEPEDSTAHKPLSHRTAPRNQIQELSSDAEPIQMKWLLSLGQWHILTCCCVQTILTVQLIMYNTMQISNQFSVHQFPALGAWRGYELGLHNKGSRINHK